jgi:VanZ family protein
MNDKVMHFTAFFLLATILCYCTNSEKSLRRFGSIIAVCFVYGLLDEWSQSFIRGRTADVYDLVADVSGAVSAVTIYAVGRMVWKRLKMRRLAMISQ